MHDHFIVSGFSDPANKKKRADSIYLTRTAVSALLFNFFKNNIMFKILKQFLPVFFLGIIAFSCNEEENMEANAPKEQEPVEQSKHFVNKQEVSNLAAAIEFSTPKNSPLRAKGITSAAKEVKSVTPIPDESGNTSYYIINYTGGGFLILSADKRVNPVLAHSDSNAFPVDAEEYPGGLAGWLAKTKEHVVHVRKTVSEQSKILQKSWELDNIRQMINTSEKKARQGTSDLCTQVLYSPLVKTQWGQNRGFNDMLDRLGCRQTGNWRVPTGCVATAMAQIMKYYRYPSNYNWDAMYKVGGSYETRRLMKKIGKAVHMNYACDGSKASAKEIASSFKDDFGYSYAYSRSVSYTTQNSVEQEIRGGHPVILTGCSLDVCHAWICDGYVKKYWCSLGQDFTFTFFHMNWGWTGFADGFYSFDYLHPQDNRNPDYKGYSWYKYYLQEYDIRP